MNDDKKIHEYFEEIEESSAIVSSVLSRINIAAQKINYAFKMLLKEMKEV